MLYFWSFFQDSFNSQVKYFFKNFFASRISAAGYSWHKLFNIPWTLRMFLDIKLFFQIIQFPPFATLPVQPGFSLWISFSTALVYSKWQITKMWSKTFNWNLSIELNFCWSTKLSTFTVPTLSRFSLACTFCLFCLFLQCFLRDFFSRFLYLFLYRMIDPLSQTEIHRDLTVNIDWGTHFRYFLVLSKIGPTLGLIYSCSII